MGGVELVSIGERGRGEGISYLLILRLLGCFLVVYFGGVPVCSCCDRGKIKSTPSLRLRLGLWTGV